MSHTSLIIKHVSENEIEAYLLIDNPYGKSHFRGFTIHQAFGRYCWEDQDYLEGPEDTFATLADAIKDIERHLDRESEQSYELLCKEYYGGSV